LTTPRACVGEGFAVRRVIERRIGRDVVVVVATVAVVVVVVVVVIIVVVASLVARVGRGSDFVVVASATRKDIGEAGRTDQKCEGCPGKLLHSRISPSSSGRQLVVGLRTDVESGS
jgi:hypothetical protein